jgi:hypothetical protein
MSRSCLFLLASLMMLAAPGTAFADCPSTLTLQKRIDCLNAALNAAVTTITDLQTANDALEDGNAELQAQLDALDDEVTNISADYLVSGDLDDVVTWAYLNPVLEGFTNGIPNLSDYLSVDTATDSIVFTGANVFVQSGSGATDGPVNGLGNLVVGYNEVAEVFGGSDRSGSHNLVVGAAHSYSSYGGFVTGWQNSVTGPGSSVCGGATNVASGSYSSVSGGFKNEASASTASVSGGYSNEASGGGSSVSGGAYNHATGDVSSVSGGEINYATKAGSSVSGGETNGANGFFSSVSGGQGNDASGDYSSVLGGHGVAVSTDHGTSP